MNVGIEKIDTHKERTVKALLDSRAIGMFMSKSLAQKGGYRLIKLRLTFTSKKCGWHQ